MQPMKAMCSFSQAVDNYRSWEWQYHLPSLGSSHQDGIQIGSCRQSTQHRSKDSAVPTWPHRSSARSSTCPADSRRLLSTRHSLPPIEAPESIRRAAEIFLKTNPNESVDRRHACNIKRQAAENCSAEEAILMDVVFSVAGLSLSPFLFSSLCCAKPQHASQDREA